MQQPLKIATSNVAPPIPARSLDWCAYIDGREEDGGYSYGRNEAAAVVAFTEDHLTFEALAGLEWLLQRDIDEAKQDGRNASFIAGLESALRTVQGIL